MPMPAPARVRIMVVAEEGERNEYRSISWLKLAMS